MEECSLSAGGSAKHSESHGECIFSSFVTVATVRGLALKFSGLGLLTSPFSLQKLSAWNPPGGVLPLRLQDRHELLNLHVAGALSTSNDKMR